MHGLQGEAPSIVITVEPHAGIRRRCSHCQKPAPAMTACPNGAGSSCLCGESPPTFATRHGEWSVPNMGS